MSLGADYYEQAEAEARAAAQAAIDTEAQRAEWRKQRRKAARKIRIPMRKLGDALDARPRIPADIGEQAGHLARAMAGLVGVFGQDAALTAGGKPGSMNYRTAKRLYKKARALLERAIGKAPNFRASWAAEIHAFRVKAGLVPLAVVSVVAFKPAEQQASTADLLDDLRSQVDDYMAGSGVKTPADQEQQAAEISELRIQVAALELAETAPPPPPELRSSLPPVIEDEPSLIESVIAHAEDNPLLWGAGALAAAYGGYRLFKWRRGT
jgi:hypothetical protein